MHEGELTVLEGLTKDLAIEVTTLLRYREQKISGVHEPYAFFLWLVELIEQLL